MPRKVSSAPVICGMCWLACLPLIVSTILGGVYFPTSALPPALGDLAEWLPLTAGLRALRQCLLLGYPLSVVATDVARVLGGAALWFAAGAVALRWAFAYARRAGSLSQY